MSFTIFWYNVSNSTKSLLRLHVVCVRSSIPNDQAFSFSLENMYEELLCTVCRIDLTVLSLLFN